MKYKKNDTYIQKKIIEYLLSKQDFKDDLDGIILTIMDSELYNLKDIILENLSYLITKLIVTEYVDSYGKRVYQLNKNKD